MLENSFTAYPPLGLLIPGVCLIAVLFIGSICYTWWKEMEKQIRMSQLETISLEKDKEKEFYQQLYERVIAVMEKEQLYLQPNLTLNELAQKAMTNRTHLSNAINIISQRNFNVWLSEYRVNYFIQLVNHKKDAQIDQLFREAGFSSRSSFYRQFKQIKGITPKQFMTQLTGTTLHPTIADQ